MGSVAKYLRGTAVITVDGAAQQLFLNRLAREGIAVLNIRRVSELSLEVTVFRRDAAGTAQLAERAQCQVSRVEEKGLHCLLARLKKRPVFLLGLVLTVAALVLLPQFVWQIRVEGAERIPEGAVLQKLEEMGLAFGTWGPSIQPGSLRDRLLNGLPELRWCAVNRSGSFVTVTVRERDLPAEPKPAGPANLIAARAGMIDEVIITRGFRQCKVGDAVEKGQLLVSGLATWPMGTQAVRAEGEIYALTNRKTRVVFPAIATAKQYSGEEMTCYTLIIGRKRIKLSGNSGILPTGCDKITEYKQLVLPGGFGFPVALEIQRWIPYTPVPTEVSQELAEERMLHYAERSVTRDMVAGTVLNTRHTITGSSDCWLLTAIHSCREMIARTVPVPIIGTEDRAP